MEGCENLVVFTKLLIIAHGVSQLLKPRRDSGALRHLQEGIGPV